MTATGCRAGAEPAGSADSNADEVALALELELVADEDAGGVAVCVSDALLEALLDGVLVEVVAGVDVTGAVFDGAGAAEFDPESDLPELSLPTWPGGVPPCPGGVPPCPGACSLWPGPLPPLP